MRLGVAHVPDGPRHLRGPERRGEPARSAPTRARDKADVGADFERVYGYFPRLKERRRQQAGTLSGGEQQMLAVSRALMLRPRLLLLDEPSFGLAPLIVQRAVRASCARSTSERRHRACCWSSRTPRWRSTLADHAYLLETGRVVMSGPAERSATTRRCAARIWATETGHAWTCCCTRSLSGLATGGIYASLALALVMIYQATHLVNFAQGEMAMFATYIAWTLMQAGVPYWVAFVAHGRRSPSSAAC